MIVCQDVFSLLNFLFWMMSRRQSIAAVTADDALLLDASSCTPSAFFVQNNSAYFMTREDKVSQYICNEFDYGAFGFPVFCHIQKSVTDHSVHKIMNSTATELFLCNNTLVQMCTSQILVLGEVDFITSKSMILLLSRQWKQLVTCDTNRSINSRRQPRETLLINRKTRNCHVMLVADHLFFTHVGRGKVPATVQEMLAALHFADAIFRGTDFDGDKSGDNIGFVVANVTVIQEPSKTGLKYAPSASSAQEYLASFSRNNFDKYCLAVAFTFIDFADSVDAASNVAKTDPGITHRGICSRSQQFTDGVVSYNTLVVSYLSNGAPSPFETTHVSLTHELGHSFGSDHDITALCSQGHYLMHGPLEKDGDIINPQFSVCSIRQIYPVLMKQGHCLTSRLGPVCGNTIVEEGEECDCGSREMCDVIDRCCTPADVPIHDPDKPCTVRASKDAQCSAVVSPCCTVNCTFTPRKANKICHTETDCNSVSICNGWKSDCPQSEPKPNGTLCHKGSRMCGQGLCLHSVCRKRDFIECLCPDKQDHCKVCCKVDMTSTCQPATKFGILSLSGDTVYHPQGASCAGYSGVCNSEHVCIYSDMPAFSSDAFSDTNKQSFSGWIMIYWKQVLTTVSVFLVFVALFALTRWRYNARKAKALKMLHLTLLLRQATEQHQQCAESIHSLDEFSDTFAKQIEDGKTKRPYMKAIARLHYLFPTAPLNILIHAAEMSSMEDIAVRLLLSMEYPMVGSRNCLKPSSQIAIDTTGAETVEEAFSFVCDGFDSCLDVREPSEQMNACMGDSVLLVCETKRPDTPTVFTPTDICFESKQLQTLNASKHSEHTGYIPQYAKQEHSRSREVTSVRSVLEVTSVHPEQLNTPACDTGMKRPGTPVFNVIRSNTPVTETDIGDFSNVQGVQSNTSKFSNI